MGLGPKISDTMRDSMTALFSVNGGSDLTKDWTKISGTMRFMN
jgi:hypothetical protein